MTDIFQEIDEELRWDRLHQFWHRHRWSVFALAALIVAGTAGVTEWRDWQKQQDMKLGAEFSAAESLATADPAKAVPQLEAMGGGGSGGYRLLARFRAASLKLTGPDKAGGVATYDAIAADAGVDQAYRDLATILSALNDQIDTAPKADVVAKVQKLAIAPSPWRFSAIEISALADLKAGDRDGAVKLYQSLADDLDAPQAARARAAEVIEALRPKPIARNTATVHPPRLIALLLVVSVTLLAGCGMFDSKKPKLPGQRISVLELEKQLEPDPGLAQMEVALPKPSPNRDWPQAGGTPSHDMGHPALSDPLSIAWIISVGQGSSRYAEVLAGPVIEDGVVYAMDSTSLVTARAAADGHEIWRFDVTPKDDDNQAWGGGVAYDGGRIFVSTGFAELIALDAKTGQVIWRTPTVSPLRGPPTVSDGRVYVVTVDNELVAASVQDGHRLWDYEGVPESAVLAGSASPAVANDVVVAPFSSGEIVALRVENGRMVWTDSLSATRRFDPMSTLADVRGRPVIDRGRVYAVSHSGRMTAMDLRSGSRIWEQDIGGVNAPWVAGDFVYVLTTSAELICLTRDEGRIRWLTQLDQYEDSTDKSNPIQWTGPVLAGDRLVVIASNGEAWSVSPYTGKPLGRVELPAGSFLPPVVADGTLYLMTNEADLMALR